MPREKHIKNITFTQNESVDFHVNNTHGKRPNTKALYIKRANCIPEKLPTRGMR